MVEMTPLSLVLLLVVLPALVLVFDPTNSLALASKTRKSGKFSGLPCDVYRVRRLENGWYAVQFYTEADWEHCG
jgi:hypothetical protein